MDATIWKVVDSGALQQVKDNRRNGFGIQKKTVHLQRCWPEYPAWHPGYSAVRLAHLLWEQGVAGSNPATPTRWDYYAKF